MEAVAGEKVQVRAVEDAAVSVVEMPAEQPQADTQVGNVGHRDHEDAAGRGARGQVAQGGARLGQVLEHVGQHDHVGRVNEAGRGFLQKTGEHLLVVRPGDVGPLRVGFDAVEVQPHALAHPPQCAAGGADIQHLRARRDVFQPAGQGGVARPGVEFVLIGVQNGSGDEKIMNVFIIPEGGGRGFYRIERWATKVFGTRYWVSGMWFRRYGS